MLGLRLSCSAACNGSPLPNTLHLNTFVAVDKDLHIGLTLLFFFFFLVGDEETLFFHINTSYWFQQIPCTYDMNTCTLFHPPLSSSQNLLFSLQPAKILPRYFSHSKGGQTFFIKKPDSKYFSFCSPCSLCCNHSTLLQRGSSHTVRK